jgi:hypothetical protein
LQRLSDDFEVDLGVDIERDIKFRYKDLGVNIDNELKFSKRIEGQVNKANKQLGLIRRSF